MIIEFSSWTIWKSREIEMLMSNCLEGEFEEKQGDLIIWFKVIITVKSEKCDNEVDHNIMKCHKIWIDEPLE